MRHPDEMIVWSNETAGAVEFVGGNTGRSVTVRGISPGSTHLTIQIGDSPSDPPHFPLKVVTNRVFHIKPWVVMRQDGTLTRTDTELQDMIKAVNDIYAQIGVTFCLESTCLINDPEAVELYYYATNATQGITWSVDSLLNSINQSGSINCVFIDGFLEKAKQSTLAVSISAGVVITALSNARVWGHELGHQLGAEDIYESGGLSVSVISIPFKYDFAPMDWSNGCQNISQGYYCRGITCDRIISRLLMNGEVEISNTTSIDITSGDVYGVINTSGGGRVTGDADIDLLNR